MPEKIRNILLSLGERILNRRHIPNNETKEDEAQKGGKIYAAWLLVLPLLVGLVLGRLAGVGLGYGLDMLAGNGGLSDSAVSGAREESASGEKARGLDGFLASNPFHISPEKPPVVEEAPKPVATPKAPETNLDELILRGTVPGIGVWVEYKGTFRSILMRESIERFRLTSVTYREAVFRRGRTTVKKYITYGPVEIKKPEAPKVAEAPKPAPAPTPARTGTVVAAQPGGQDGEIPSEILNKLVQNPFDEMNRIRLRPNEKVGGFEVQWIQNDSILKSLGVQRGDVIRSVNGIPFTNMGDISNSINSLMNSERFDVEVTRGGNPTALRYVVR